jgi:hypothetical protein
MDRSGAGFGGLLRGEGSWLFRRLAELFGISLVVYSGGGLVGYSEVA